MSYNDTKFLFSAKIGSKRTKMWMDVLSGECPDDDEEIPYFDI
jgi:hypothetical protein